jgi:L-alanine-DL-glutamate epimerase-like enolase superfamily enzyme
MSVPASVPVGNPAAPPVEARVQGSSGEVELSIEDAAAITAEARAMFDPVLEIKDGRAVMPDGPGWGVRIKPAWLASADRRVSGG